MTIQKAIKICEKKQMHFANLEAKACKDCFELECIFCDRDSYTDLFKTYSKIIEVLTQYRETNSNEQLASFYMLLDELGRLGESKTKRKLNQVRWNIIK